MNVDLMMLSDKRDILGTILYWFMPALYDKFYGQRTE